MHAKLRITLVLAFGVWCGMAPFVWAANMAGPLPRARVVSPERTATTYHIRDMHGHMLTAEVPALGSPEIKLSDPTQRTVGATVMAVNSHTHQVRARTQEGQILMLDLPQETVTGLRVGDQFTLNIAQRAQQ